MPSAAHECSRECWSTFLKFVAHTSAHYVHALSHAPLPQAAVTPHPPPPRHLPLLDQNQEAKSTVIIPSVRETFANRILLATRRARMQTLGCSNHGSKGEACDHTLLAFLPRVLSSCISPSLSITLSRCSTHTLSLFPSSSAFLAISICCRLQPTTCSWMQKTSVPFRPSQAF